MAQQTIQSKVIRGRKSAAKRVGIGATLSWELEKRGLFPRAIPLGARARGYLVEELDSWLAARVAERDGGTQ